MLHIFSACCQGSQTYPPGSGVNEHRRFFLLRNVLLVFLAHFVFVCVCVLHLPPAERALSFGTRRIQPSLALVNSATTAVFTVVVSKFGTYELLPIFLAFARELALLSPHGIRTHGTLFKRFLDRTWYLVGVYVSPSVFVWVWRDNS